MTDATPSMVDLILEAIDAKMIDVHTGIPGKVESYDVAKGTVNVIPQISRIIQDEDDARAVEALPRLLNVPVVFPGAGGFSVTFPIAAGDYVLVMFCEVPMGEWLASEGSDPMDERRHSLAGAIAIPGIRPTSKASANATTDKIVLGGGPVYLGTKDAAEAIPKGTTLDNYLSSLSSWVADLRSAFNTHVHVETGASTQPPTAVPPLIPALAPPSKPDTKSSKHKLDE